MGADFQVNMAAMPLPAGAASEAGLALINATLQAWPTASVQALPAVGVSASSVLIAPANKKRKGFIVFNSSSAALSVSLAEKASSDCTKQIPAGGSWECFWPFAYQGPIAAYNPTGKGTATVWEFT